MPPPPRFASYVTVAARTPTCGYELSPRASRTDRNPPSAAGLTPSSTPRTGRPDPGRKAGHLHCAAVTGETAVFDRALLDPRPRIARRHTVGYWSPFDRFCKVTGSSGQLAARSPPAEPSAGRLVSPILLAVIPHGGHVCSGSLPFSSASPVKPEPAGAEEDEAQYLPISHKVGHGTCLQGRWT